MLGLVRIFTGFSLCVAASAAELELGDVGAGRAFAQRSCSDCHNISARGGRPPAGRTAPSFYAVANAKTTTTMGLNVFLSTPHRNMPDFIISADERRDVVSYIMSLRAAR